jgi:chemotaxis protein methyltransferase CheR
LLDTLDTPALSDPAARISTGSFSRLAELITRELGIKMMESKVPMIQSRLLRRVRELGLQSIDEYCEHLFQLEDSASERIHFIDAVTTNKTDFFREPQHFQMLASSVIPALSRDRLLAAGAPLAVWSAPCSSGEEPYTLAMVLSEISGLNFRILGTDVSTKVLQKAKDAIYTEEQIQPVPADYRSKYLRRGKGEQSSLVRICPALRSTVSFHRLNFMQEDYGVRDLFHVIFCRNVLIYFDRATQEAVINKLCRNLIPGGFLFIGHSESLSGLQVPLVSAGQSCFRKVEPVK